MPPRRRTPTGPGTTRRPRVAGLTPAGVNPARPEHPAHPARPAGERTPAPPVTGGTPLPPDPVDPVGAEADRTAGSDGADGVGVGVGVGVDGADGIEAGAEDGPGNGASSAPGAQAADAEAPAADPAVPEAPDTAAGIDPVAPARPSLARRWAARPARPLAAALVLAVVLGGACAAADRLLRSTPAMQNAALVDVGVTSDVVNQLGAAVETVYSYDFTQLDENERAARAVITPAFGEKFGQLFGQVRQLAPQQQAVVSAVVTSSAVQSITGDRAVLVVFLDQQATRANPGAEPQQVNAAGRLTVTGRLVDGTWLVDDVINR